MILQALVSYYDRMAADPEVEIAPSGFTPQKIAFCVVVNEDGSLHEIQDVREREGQRVSPRVLTVPGGAKPSGSGINPGFLWDNTAYMVGFKVEDDNPERTRDSYDAFRTLHLNAKGSIPDAEYEAVCGFLAAWSPDGAAERQPVLKELGNGFGVFRIRGRQHYVHEQPAVQAYALSRGEGQEDVAVGQCLITGREAPLARLHQPRIKGVSGAQSAGGLLVSFNLDAFASYGKDQSYNAPVSQEAAFKYATALNHLLRRGSAQRVQIGDATTVFWTQRPSRAEMVFGQVIGSQQAEDEGTRLQVESVLRRISQGAFAEELGDPETPFHVLGLSPNASRISVRFWYVSTLAELCQRLGQHFADLGIARSPRDPEFPAFWQLLSQTARESKDIPPLLGGALMRSVLSGGAYPEALYGAILRRIRADRQVNCIRAGILKACLTRKERINPQSQFKEIAMSLDPDRPEPAYHLGRLFAVLEKAQEDASEGKLNATIKDRYFSAASATPGSVFPRLNRLAQHHLSKLSQTKPGLRVNHEKLIQEIVDHLTDFPAQLGMHDQGLFAIGYYQQRQDLFTKKPTPEETAEATAQEKE